MSQSYKLVFNLLLLFGVLFLTWVVLSGYVTHFFLLAGAVSCVIAVFVAYRMDMVEGEYFHRPLYFSFRALAYFGWLLKEIALSSFATAKTVWQLNPNISPILGCVPSTQKTDVATALYANSITLTPGTVSVMIDKKKILVHALQKEGYKDLARGEMDSRVSAAMGGK